MPRGPVNRSPVRKTPEERRPAGSLPSGGSSVDRDDDEAWGQVDAQAAMSHWEALRAYEAERERRAMARASELPDGRVAVDLGLLLH
jgi:hypothetical protein